MLRMRCYGSLTLLEYTHLSLSIRSLILGGLSRCMFQQVPPRVHFFLWLVINNRALTRDNLAKRRKVEDENCLFCLEKETIQHVFFDCVVARQCWRIVSDILGYQVIESMLNIGKFWLSNKRHCIVNMITSAVIWSVWKLRNDLCF